MSCSFLLNNHLLKQNLIESFEINFNQTKLNLFNNHSDWIEGLNQWVFNENHFLMNLKIQTIYFDEDLRFYLPKKEIPLNLNSNQQQQFKKIFIDDQKKSFFKRNIYRSSSSFEQRHFNEDQSDDDLFQSNRNQGFLFRWHFFEFVKIFFSQFEVENDSSLSNLEHQQSLFIENNQENSLIYSSCSLDHENHFQLKSKSKSKFIDHDKKDHFQQLVEQQIKRLFKQNSINQQRPSIPISLINIKHQNSSRSHSTNLFHHQRNQRNLSTTILQRYDKFRQLMINSSDSNDLSQAQLITDTGLTVKSIGFSLNHNDNEENENNHQRNRQNFQSKKFLLKTKFGQEEEKENSLFHSSDPMNFNENLNENLNENRMKINDQQQMIQVHFNSKQIQLNSILPTNSLFVKQSMRKIFHYHRLPSKISLETNRSNLILPPILTGKRFSQNPFQKSNS